MLLRWGILSTGTISRDFCIAFSALPEAEHKLTAVAARTLENAKEFAKEFEIPETYSSYDELVQSANVDIVYIGTITTAHYECARKSLEHGKHVLCEKPMCLNVKQTEELIQLARKKKLFLMEAIWSRHFPSYLKLKEELEKGTIGDPVQVIAPFGFHHSLGYKVKEKALGAGTMLDIGIYGVQLASLVFNGDTPLNIKALGHLNKDGADISTSSTVLYDKGRTATIITHNNATLSQEATIIGTKGTITLPMFWTATEVITPNEAFSFPLPETKRKPALPHSEGLSYQCVEARRCIMAGLTESPRLTLDESLTISTIIQDIRKQVGVVYPGD